MSETQLEQSQSVNQESVDNVEPQIAPDVATSPQTAADEIEHVFEIEGASAPVLDEETPLHKTLRAAQRETEKRFQAELKRRQELEQELEQLRAGQSSQYAASPAMQPAGQRFPSLQEFGYDEDRYQAAVAQYYQRQTEQQNRKQAEQAELQTHYGKYQAAKNDLQTKLPDYDSVESLVIASLDDSRQMAIIKHAKNPALVAYALGKNPQWLQELQNMTDPVGIGRLFERIESKSNLNSRTKPKVQPEQSLSGSGGTTAITAESLLAKYGDDPAKYRAEKKKLRAAGIKI
jgi:hypothetical protein